MDQSDKTATTTACTATRTNTDRDSITRVDILPIPIMVRDLRWCEKSGRTPTTTKRRRGSHPSIELDNKFWNTSARRPREKSRIHGSHRFGDQLLRNTQSISRRVSVLVVLNNRSDEEPSTLELAHIFTIRCNSGSRECNPKMIQAHSNPSSR